VSAPPRIVRLGIRVRAEAAEPALAALLPVLGAGAEERRVGGAVEYAIYAPPGELPPPEAIAALAGDALLGTITEPVPDGWERRYLEFLRPVEVTAGARTLRIRAPWLDGAPDDLLIDPQATFGAATHPTTRLALELLLEAEPGGGLADWGAGSGVLAVAAARLGWAPVTAFELDPAAAAVIEGNARANGVNVTVELGDLREDPLPSAPTVVANLTGPLHRAAAARMGERPERLLAAGMLARDTDAIAAAYAAAGLREQRRRTDGEWGALELAP
jgi:ribosomal protein L11 methyltransferase